MFNLYRDEMPNQEKITKEVQSMMMNLKNHDLFDINRVIQDHILESWGVNPENNENSELEHKANSMANEAMLDVISNLEINETNVKELLYYSEACSVWRGLNKLIMHCSEFLEAEERKRLIDTFTGVFTENLTEHWK